MSIVLRCVDISAKLVKIKEYILRFLKVYDTTRKGLFKRLIDAIKVLELALMMYEDEDMIIVLILKENNKVYKKDY